MVDCPLIMDCAIAGTCHIIYCHVHQPMNIIKATTSDVICVNAMLIIKVLNVGVHRRENLILCVLQQTVVASFSLTFNFHGTYLLF